MLDTRALWVLSFIGHLFLWRKAPRTEQDFSSLCFPISATLCDCSNLLVRAKVLYVIWYTLNVLAEIMCDVWEVIGFLNLLSWQTDNLVGWYWLLAFLRNIGSYEVGPGCQRITEFVLSCTASTHVSSNSHLLSSVNMFFTTLETMMLCLSRHKLRSKSPEHQGPSAPHWGKRAFLCCFKLGKWYNLTDFPRTFTVIHDKHQDIIWNGRYSSDLSIHTFSSLYLFMLTYAWRAKSIPHTIFRK